MKVPTETKIVSRRKTAVPVVSVQESKHEPVAIAPRIVKRGTCSTLNLKGELTYAIGVDSRGEVQLRVVENSNAGSFSDEWLAFRTFQTAFDRAPKGEPVSAYMLYPLFRGKSSNCCYFCAAVLKSEGLLLPSEERKKRFQRVDPTAWLADMRQRAESRTADATGDKSTRKPAVQKTAASKAKKTNKVAKS